MYRTIGPTRPALATPSRRPRTRRSPRSGTSPFSMNNAVIKPQAMNAAMFGMIIPDRNVPNFWTATREALCLLLGGGAGGARVSCHDVPLPRWPGKRMIRSTLLLVCSRRRRTGPPDGPTINPIGRIRKWAGTGAVPRRPEPLSRSLRRVCDHRSNCDRVETASQYSGPVDAPAVRPAGTARKVGGQASNSRISSADSGAPPGRPASAAVPSTSSNSLALPALSAITFSSIVASATYR